MNKFIEPKLKKYTKTKSILLKKKKEIFDKIYEIANDKYQEWWQDCGLLPYTVINTKDFCEWLKINKPKTYKNAVNVAAKEGEILENLDLDIVLSYATGGTSSLVISGSGGVKRTSGIVTIDIKSEYDLVTGANDEIEEERQVEIIAEYATVNKDTLTYLEEAFKEAESESDEDEEDEEDDW